MKAEKLSYRAMAERLNGEGVPALRGERWHHNTISELLREMES
jgi:hypothetical protein